jgi:hypothetical protein
MSDRKKTDIELGILSIGREWDKSMCRCDPEVGCAPCRYCAEHGAILAGERLLEQLAAARAAAQHYFGMQTYFGLIESDHAWMEKCPWLEVWRERELSGNPGEVTP